MSARLVIAGTHSGVGKTTLTAGILTALRRRGLIVQPFKVGPDYIDPTYHTLAAGRPCRNLDTWMVPPERVRSLFARAMHGVDVAVIEGVMGLYDGAGYDGEAGSTAEVARLLAAPVFVVLDAPRLARSTAAVALGFQHFDDGLPWGGFIINRAAGESHGRGIAAAVARATGLPVLGWLPREEALRVPERHLGLVPTLEPGRWQEFTEAAGDFVARHLDLDRLLAIARHAPPLPAPDAAEPCPAGVRPVIAVARDEAFHFTYEDNLDLLRAAGAEIAFFSPLRDAALPAGAAGIILSGGFPEVHAARLAANREMHAALQAAHQRALPIYAECGGLMYLTQALVDGEQREHAMVGLLPGRCVMSGRLTLGYRQARSGAPSWFLGEGETIRGHEFHYSAWEGRPDTIPPAYFLLPRSGADGPRPEGARVGNLWASYVHVHLATRPELAGRFVAACREAGSLTPPPNPLPEAGRGSVSAPPFPLRAGGPGGLGPAPEPRREVLDLPAAVHGSPDIEELRSLGQRPEEVLDFSANLNPYGPSPAVRAAVTRTAIDQYPDRASLRLRAALAESPGVGPEQILPGNGASELIWLAALAFLRPGSRVLVLGPTFCEYARAAELMGAQVATWRAREESDFAPEPAAVAELLQSRQPHVLFLCNPNNPTGAVLPAEVLADWACHHSRTLFVVDEAYLPFSAGLASAVAFAGANVLVLRSMTKDFGLAGLRLGYAVADARTIDLLRRVQPPWSVNGPAQAAGVAALGDPAHRQRSLAQLARAKDELTDGLTALGLAPVASATHFFLLRVGDGSGFRQALLRRGVLVRDCASFGLPAHVRIAARRPEENQRLLAAIREVL